MGRLWRSLLGTSVFLYPLAMHWFIVRNMIDAALFGLLAVSTAACVAQWLDRDGLRRGAWPYLLVASAALAGLGGGEDFALYLPPVIFNLLLAGVFGRTLRRGETSLIERFMRLYHRHHGPFLSTLGRQLTWVWTLFFVSCAAVGALLAVFAARETWSLFANCINYLLVLVLFLGQFVYAYVRYRALPLPEIVPTALRVVRRAVSHTPLNR